MLCEVKPVIEHQLPTLAPMRHGYPILKDFVHEFLLCQTAITHFGQQLRLPELINLICRYLCKVEQGCVYVLIYL
jgi:hypothetical protein